ncbi:MAG: mechanosensitive ion channel family protein [Janthinobacterium lividum]
MRSVVTTLLIATTALVWLFVVTLSAETNHWWALLRAFALFLSAICVGRIIEVSIAGLIDDRRAHRATDLVRAMSSVVIYLGVLICWLYFGLGFDVTNLLATSAVVSVVLGFALQTTLGNLFAGLSLELERPIRVGDYLRKPPYEGTIVALKWRSIHLRTTTGSLVILPNSALAAAPVEMISKSAPIRHVATLHVANCHPPVLVLGLIRQALSSGLHPGILGDPPPNAVLIGTEARSTAIVYGARFYTDQPGDLGRSVPWS